MNNEQHLLIRLSSITKYKVKGVDTEVSSWPVILRREGYLQNAPSSPPPLPAPLLPSCPSSSGRGPSSHAGMRILSVACLNIYHLFHLQYQFSNLVSEENADPNGVYWTQDEGAEESNPGGVCHPQQE